MGKTRTEREQNLLSIFGLSPHDYAKAVDIGAKTGTNLFGPKQLAQDSEAVRLGKKPSFVDSLKKKAAGKMGTKT